MKSYFKKYNLPFKIPSGTSRGVLTSKDTYLLYLENEDITAVGECNLFKGLSVDDVPEYEQKLTWLCQNIHLPTDEILSELLTFPSLIFGYEQLMLHYHNLCQNKDLYMDSDFTNRKQGIKTNGLIWMGSIDFMQQQIEEKLQQNFECIKLKIGINWKEEFQLISELRKEYPAEILELRVDANGAFTYEEAKVVLQQLSDLQIHSIEQPIKKGQFDEMRKLCKNTPTPIALDEELIGIFHYKERKEMLETIKPQYIILKPALIGGISGSNEWIEIAENQHIKWWITSALESNIGLNALAQWTYTLGNRMPQGLGTGGLFSQNFPSKTEMINDELWYK